MVAIDWLNQRRILADKCDNWDEVKLIHGKTYEFCGTIVSCIIYFLMFEMTMRVFNRQINLNRTDKITKTTKKGHDYL